MGSRPVSQVRRIVASSVQELESYNLRFWNILSGQIWVSSRNFVSRVSLPGSRKIEFGFFFDPSSEGTFEAPTIAGQHLAPLQLILEFKVYSHAQPV